ncbi:MAG: hypothetical protein L0Y72_04880 [Gemmataceae bacterium]|nr:hypothetical protein [Gemmataceae bacterium]MCI0738356.1 hypothetical protein [Gemmataceae bacterium]
MTAIYLAVPGAVDFASAKKITAHVDKSLRPDIENSADIFGKTGWRIRDENARDIHEKVHPRAVLCKGVGDSFHVMTAAAEADEDDAGVRIHLADLPDRLGEPVAIREPAKIRFLETALLQVSAQSVEVPKT